jgi:type I restriction enzyme M protein
MSKQDKNNNGKVISTQAGMDKAVKGICDILRRDKAKGARLYVPELTWMFFLRYLDLQETQDELKAAALGNDFTPTLQPPYRWQDWAAAFDNKKDRKEIIANKETGWKRCELDNKGIGAFLDFVNNDLFEHLKTLKDKENATNKQKIVSEIFITKEKTVLTSQANLMNALDGVHNLTASNISTQHLFPISQVFEGLLPSLGEKANDGGQFFTPREVIRVIIEAVKPELDKKIYDPCCGTGGFLIEAFKYIDKNYKPLPTQRLELQTNTFFGREYADEAIPILLANMVLHDINLPRIWHGNTLTGDATYKELYEGAPQQFDYIFTNPPFGSKESAQAQSHFAYKTGKAQILFIQHIITSLKDGGTCGMVIDEGVLFHTKTAAYTQTKRKLLNDCNLWCIVSLPTGVFINAGAGVKTDLLFFTKGQPTKKVWYYDMTLTEDFKPRKVNKGNTLNLNAFDDFFRRLALPENHAEKTSERSWYVTMEEIEAKEFDLKAVNNNAPDFSDIRSIQDLYTIIEETQTEISERLMKLKTL